MGAAVAQFDLGQRIVQESPEQSLKPTPTDELAAHIPFSTAEQVLAQAERIGQSAEELLRRADKVIPGDVIERKKLPQEQSTEQRLAKFYGVRQTQQGILFRAHYPHAENVHLAATEHEGSIVFLHSVQPGPASQSYGIQVARLAGVPDTVLSSARERLQALEQSQAGQEPVQRDLFNLASEAEPALSPQQAALVEAVGNLDPDGLSPREALLALYALKDTLEGSD